MLVFAGHEGLVLLIVLQFTPWSSFRVMQFGTENPRGRSHILHFICLCNVSLRWLLVCTGRSDDLMTVVVEPCGGTMKEQPRFPDVLLSPGFRKRESTGTH